MAEHLRGSFWGETADSLVSFLSGEWILNWTAYTANGGTVVAARALWLTAWLYLPALLLKTSLGEGKVWVFDARQGAADLVETLPWLAATFAAAYAALYSRFASQWNYLAGLYNQIVESQLAMPADNVPDRLRVLAAWKAGFIEDAEELHLATKPVFLVAVRQWGMSPLVAQEYAANTVGGEDRLTALLLRLEVIWTDADDKRRDSARRQAATLQTLNGTKARNEGGSNPQGPAA